jgi:hypothetical protein
LDFDNIVEEEETNCKKRFQDICNAIRKFTKQEFKIKNGEEILELKRDITGDYTSFDEPEGKGMRKVDVIFTAHEYGPTVPEEIYCKALEVFDEIWASKTFYTDTVNDIDLGNDYRIRPYNYQWMKGIRIMDGVNGVAVIYFATSFGDNSKIILNNKEFTKEELFKKVKGILP